ncbi:hypothetical protein [Pseudomonas antarctica]|uniref:hypothetical protein n=1 Tax=Pseudomonas antarctica TaxID=219572 RepID=UPI003F754888
MIKAARTIKVHGLHLAQQLVASGWTVKHEFKAENETYECYLEWEHVGEPPVLSPRAGTEAS